MGLYIRLSITGEFGPLDQAQIRLDYGIEVAKWWQASQFFKPSNVEFWSGGFSESLGGHKFGTIPISRGVIDEGTGALILKSFANHTPDDRFYSIIVINGFWKFGATSLGGYVSINNLSSSRNLYTDIALEIYPKGGIEDLVELLLQEEPEGFIPSFANELRVREKGRDVTYSRIIASLGPPDLDDITAPSLLVLNTSNDEDLIGFMYKTMHQKKEPILRDHLDTNFLVGHIKKDELGVSKLHRDMQMAMIVSKPSGSVTLIAKQKDSFKKLYESYLVDVFTPVFQKLPSDEEYEDKIKKGLRAEK